MMSEWLRFFGDYLKSNSISFVAINLCRSLKHYGIEDLRRVTLAVVLKEPKLVEDKLMQWAKEMKKAPADFIKERHSIQAKSAPLKSKTKASTRNTVTGARAWRPTEGIPLEPILKKLWIDKQKKMNLYMPQSDARAQMYSAAEAVKREKKRRDHNKIALQHKWHLLHLP